MIKSTFAEVGEIASQLAACLNALEETCPLDPRDFSLAANCLAETASDRAEGKRPGSNKEASATVNGMIDQLLKALHNAPQKIQCDQNVQSLRFKLMDLRDRKV